MIAASEREEGENYWQNELRSLGIEPRRTSELNDREELEALAEKLKQMYYQEYKTAYEDPKFDSII